MSGAGTRSKEAGSPRARRPAITERLLRAAETGHPPWFKAPLRYTAALVAVAVTAALQRQLLPDPSLAPYALFFFSAALVSFLAGRGPGLITVALSALVVNVLVHPPHGRLAWSAETVAATLAFLASAAAISTLSALFRDALLESARRSRTIRAQVQTLEAVQRALERSEALARARSEELMALLEAVPAPIWIAHDPEARVLTGNRAAHEVAGIPPDQNASLTPGGAAAMPAYRAMKDGRPIPGDELPVQRAARTAERVTGAELELIRPDGTHRTLLGDAIPLPGPGGATRGAVGAFIDITARKQAEAELLEREEQLRLVVEASGAGVWDWDLETNALVWSDRCRELFGVPPGAPMTYERFLAAVHPDDRARVEDVVRRTLAERRNIDVEMRVAAAEGEPRWIVSRGQARFDAAGRPTRVSGIVLDVTQRRRVEDSLRLADQRKSDFLGVLSHELRNPLSALLNSLHVLRSAQRSPQQAHRALDTMERQARLLARLIEDLLDVTRVSRGKIRLRRERLDVAEVARRVVEDLRPLFDAVGVALDLQVRTEGPLAIHADVARVSQILGNLLQNAMKFTPAGGWTRVAVERAGAEAVLTVEDSGAGMVRELLERLFQPFVQAEGTLARAAGGLGLGLALVKALAELHGGSVSAESEGPGRGSRFTVRLPVDRRRVERPTSADAARALPAARVHVLLIEDNLDAATTLKDALELDGYSVVLAHSAAEGLARARAARPEVILCDIGLPGADGYEVARALRADADLRGTRLIALSGYAQPDDVERALRAGFDGHVAKPPDIAELERSIQPPLAAAPA